MAVACWRWSPLPTRSGSTPRAGCRISGTTTTCRMATTQSATSTAGPTKASAGTTGARRTTDTLPAPARSDGTFTRSWRTRVGLMAGPVLRLARGVDATGLKANGRVHEARDEADSALDEESGALRATTASAPDHRHAASTKTESILVRFNLVMRRSFALLAIGALGLGACSAAGSQPYSGAVVDGGIAAAVHGAAQESSSPALSIAPESQAAGSPAASV